MMSAHEHIYACTPVCVHTEPGAGHAYLPLLLSPYCLKTQALLGLEAQHFVGDEDKGQNLENAKESLPLVSLLLFVCLFLCLCVHGYSHPSVYGGRVSP